MLILASMAQADEVSGKSVPAPSVDSATTTAEDLRFARNLSRAFRHVAKGLQPSVVSIRTIEGGATPVVARGPMRFRMGPGGLQPEGAVPQREGQGTGFVLREDGTILTNNHVIRGASQIAVRLSDGREFPATVLGGDPETDVAVLRIDTKGLTPVRVIESGEVEVGDWVLALGNPFGLEQTVTAGIISAKGRDEVGLATFENYLQTDAAINPGNSGGPLCTLDGAVVGMNTAIGSRTGGNDGVGFAIPMEIVKRAADDILQDGRVRYGYMGVMLQDLGGEQGAMIANVLPGGPADKAGIQRGDVIRRVDGISVGSRASLMRAIGAKTPGTVVKLDLLRDGMDVSAEVTLATRPTAGVAVRDERGDVLEPGR
jgi:serine protease Do